MTKKPVDFDELYPGRFIKAGELKGKQVTLTIADVDIDELEGDKGKQMKGIISFKETQKQLVLNKTNGLCIRAMFGRKLFDWAGKRLTIFPGKWGQDDAIRIWGSPDIALDAEVIVTLPRKKPFPMTMHKVELKAQREPGDES